MGKLMKKKYRKILKSGILRCAQQSIQILFKNLNMVNMFI